MCSCHGWPIPIDARAAAPGATREPAFVVDFDTAYSSAAGDSCCGATSDSTRAFTIHAANNGMYNNNNM